MKLVIRTLTVGLAKGIIDIFLFLTQSLPLLQGESHPLEEPGVPDVINPHDQARTG